MGSIEVRRVDVWRHLWQTEGRREECEWCVCVTLSVCSSVSIMRGKRLVTCSLSQPHIPHIPQVWIVPGCVWSCWAPVSWSPARGPATPTRTAPASIPAAPSLATVETAPATAPTPRRWRLSLSMSTTTPAVTSRTTSWWAGTFLSTPGEEESQWIPRSPWPARLGVVTTLSVSGSLLRRSLNSASWSPAEAF